MIKQHPITIAYSLLLVIATGTVLFFWQQPHINNNKLTIVCTTTMILDAVQEIAGDDATVIGLMGPGIDPHLYRAKAHDVQAIASADIIFYNGLHLEGKMTDLFAHMQQQCCTVALGERLPQEKLLHHDQHIDPHIWHDVSRWMIALQAITQTLIAYDPDHAAGYQQRSVAYQQKLLTVDTHLKTILAQLRPDQKIIVTAHDAFAYFGDAYGFQVIGLQGMSTDAEISTQDIQNLVSFIVQHRVPTIFIETAIAHKSIRALQEAVAAHGWQVDIGPELYADALGDKDSVAGSYVAMMHYHGDTLVQTLKK